VLKVAERLKGHRQGAVSGLAVDPGDKADPAGVVLETGVIEAVDISLRKLHRFTLTTG
jgi:hypothetical protein